MAAESPPRPFRGGAWLVALGALGVLAVTAGLLAYFHPWRGRTGIPATQPPSALPADDPRLTYQGPYANVRPEVEFVGDEACAACHDKETQSFRRHPMGRSILPMTEFTAEPSHDRAHNNPFERLGSRFEVVCEGGRVVHREVRIGVDGKPVYSHDTPVDYVIGSGAHGHSYFSVHDGFVFQSPISFYSQKQVFDLSPGFQFDRSLFSGRAIGPECLFCHANQARPHPGSMYRFDLPLFSGHVIGCERCHGPGGDHVANPGVRLNIVNPSDREHLTPALSDAVCEQCHLEGAVRVLRRGRGLYDFRPGLPLEAVWDVMVHAPLPGEQYRAVSHVEQMRDSRCYRRTSGDQKMSCVGCHDPHDYVEPARQSAYYRKKCLECHGDGHGCTEPLEARLTKSKEDSCIQCHMPPTSTSDVPHIPSTDHRILRKPTAIPVKGVSAGDEPAYTLRPFGRDHIDPEDTETKRDLGIALMRVPGQGPPGRRAVATSLRLLDEALRREPDDLEAWEAKGLALKAAGQNAEALSAFEKVLALEPDREWSLAEAARLAYRPREPQQALAYFRRLVKINPWSAAYRQNLFVVLQQTGDWDEAREHIRVWLRLEPGSVEARMAMIRALLKDDNKEEARKEFAVIEAMAPDNLRDLRSWFASHLAGKDKP
jgi:tetratricopeptide (TPR) repeat protein